MKPIQSKKTLVISKQQRVGRIVTSLGQLLFALLVLVCLVDVGGFIGKETPIVPLSIYLGCIAVGVAMQFIGAAIPNMKFSSPSQT